MLRPKVESRHVFQPLGSVSSRGASEFLEIASPPHQRSLITLEDLEACFRLLLKTDMTPEISVYQLDKVLSKAKAVYDRTSVANCFMLKPDAVPKLHLRPSSPEMNGLQGESTRTLGAPGFDKKHDHPSGHSSLLWPRRKELTASQRATRQFLDALDRKLLERYTRPG